MALENRWVVVCLIPYQGKSCDWIKSFPNQPENRATNWEVSFSKDWPRGGRTSRTGLGPRMRKPLETRNWSSDLDLGMFIKLGGRQKCHRGIVGPLGGGKLEFAPVVFLGVGQKEGPAVFI